MAKFVRFGEPQHAHSVIDMERVAAVDWVSPVTGTMPTGAQAIVHLDGGGFVKLSGAAAIAFKDVFDAMVAGG
jgi:hypothetical protein